MNEDREVLPEIPGLYGDQKEKYGNFELKIIYKSISEKEMSKLIKNFVTTSRGQNQVQDQQEMFQKHTCPPWCKIQNFYILTGQYEIRTSHKAEITRNQIRVKDYSVHHQYQMANLAKRKNFWITCWIQILTMTPLPLPSFIHVLVYMQQLSYKMQNHFILLDMFTGKWKLSLLLQQSIGQTLRRHHMGQKQWCELDLLIVWPDLKIKRDHLQTFLRIWTISL